jgi:hypothetical protein
MAAGILSKPGTEYGPCAKECQHTDCRKTREMAEARCTICRKPIGYDTRFYAARALQGKVQTRTISDLRYTIMKIQKARTNMQTIEHSTGRLVNGFDYERQAWVIDGKYRRCGHPQNMRCNCYGRLHEGEETQNNGSVYSEVRP